jgi:hypothetical protein
MTFNQSRRVLFACLLSLLTARVAAAEVTFVPCDGGAAFCTGTTDVVMGGTPYKSVSGLLTKTTDDVVVYAAPLTLLYPADSADCSGKALLDLVNNSVMIVQDIDGLGFAPPLPAGTVILGADFIGRRGLVVAQLQYQGMRDPEQGPKTVIELGIDAHFYPNDADLPTTNTDVAVVVSEAANFLRHSEGQRCASNKVFAYGVSRSAMHLRHFIKHGITALDGSLLHGMPGRALGQTAPAEPPPEGTGKTIVVNSEGDIRLLASSAVRDVMASPPVATASTRWRASPTAPATWASSAVVTTSSASVRSCAACSTSSGSGRRAPSRRRAPTSTIAGVTPGPPPWRLPWESRSGTSSARKGPEDAMLGGVRLPHVYSAGGGAPLGCYSGVEPLTPYALTGGVALPLFSALVALLGVYDPACIDLGAAYPNHGSYVSKVARAARYAMSMGWIGDLDREAYVEIAANCQVGLKSSLTFAELLDCHGL